MSETYIPSQPVAPKSAVPEAAPGETARRMMRRVDRVALATAQRDGDGWPYPSLTLTALDYDGTPILLVSTLAEHTRNLLAEERVGLLFDDTGGLAEPLAGARVTVLGRAHPTEEPRHRTRYLARHPGAVLYADFRDFACYRVDIERAHLVSGFGRVHRIRAPELVLGARAMAVWIEGEGEAVERLNRDHAGAIRACAPEAAGDDPWIVTGLDPEGCDLRRDGAIARLEFPPGVAGPDAAVAALLSMAGRPSHQASLDNGAVRPLFL